MVKKHWAGAFEIKRLSEDGTFSGHGSVFGVRDSYGDVVEPGAFATSLQAWAAKGKLPKMLWQHRAAEPIGVWTKMHEDARGLFVEGRLIREVARAQEAYALMKAGAVDGLSIGYMPVVEGWDKDSQTNRVKQVDLWEVSPVTFAANEEAQIEAVKTALQNPREFERQLRDVLGLTQSEAKKLMAEGYKAVAPRDVSDPDRESQSQQEKAALDSARDLHASLAALRR